jgi:membrane-bound serine protease (ClpP class)
LGFPGFAAGLCFMLYFWSHYLNGNADWLEIMLFVLGAVSLALEIFVVPGFGIFGVGGILMMLVSVVLAAQTFVWPTSREDFSQLPVSLSMVLALFLGVAIPMMLIPKYMHRLPILNRFSLNPSEDEEFAEVSEREAISHLEYLTGKMGVAVTSLVPGGKVKFGDDVFSVVTDGRPVESGESVVVREVRGNHVLVDPVEV